MAKILYVATAGSHDPTRATLPFEFALGAIEAGHDPELYLTAEAVYLLHEDVAAAVVGVGLPPLHEAFKKLVDHRVPIFV
jgi:predicted peroxiredoxin